MEIFLPYFCEIISLLLCKNETAETVTVFYCVKIILRKE